MAGYHDTAPICKVMLLQKHLGQRSLEHSQNRELKIPESEKRESSEGKSGSIHPHGRYGNAGNTSKTISTIAILRPVKAIFKKRAATAEVDTLVSPAEGVSNFGIHDFGGAWVEAPQG